MDRLGHGPCVLIEGVAIGAHKKADLRVRTSTYLSVRRPPLARPEPRHDVCRPFGVVTWSRPFSRVVQTKVGTRKSAPVSER
jgi:hypothetical protein